MKLTTILRAHLFCCLLIAPAFVTAQPAAQIALPNQALTPGAVLEVTKADVCVPGYAKKVRNVPIELKRQVYAEYGVRNVFGKHVVDHLIPLCVGGSNSKMLSSSASPD
jgi:hypothetical protein